MAHCGLNIAAVRGIKLDFLLMPYKEAQLRTLPASPLILTLKCWTSWVSQTSKICPTLVIIASSLICLSLCHPSIIKEWLYIPLRLLTWAMDSRPTTPYISFAVGTWDIKLYITDNPSNIHTSNMEYIIASYMRWKLRGQVNHSLHRRSILSLNHP